MKVQSIVSSDWRDVLIDAGLADLTQLLSPSFDPSVFKGTWDALIKPGLGGRERWRWTLTDKDGQKRVIYVKRYQKTPFKTQWDRIVRQAATHSRAWWEFDQSALYAQKYIPAPAAVAMAEEMVGVVEGRSAVMIAEVPGDGLDRVLGRLLADNAPIVQGLARHDLTKRIARHVTAFHNTGFCHRDLYLCHIFAVVDPAGVEIPRFHLIDLGRTHRPRWRRMRWIHKDLSQLDYSARQLGASRTDRLRFLLAYLGLQPKSARVRWYAKRIVRKSDKILKREIRKGRA